MSAYLLGHLSDPHLSPLPPPRLHELLGKRITGYLNWTRNRHLTHRRDWLDSLVADLRAQHPDHIAVTGDLVNLGLDAEFPPARRWLEEVGPSNGVSLVPGNHDAYVRTVRHHSLQQWGDYMRGDEIGVDALAFPFLRKRGPLALIGLTSSNPTAPFMATGTLGKAQRKALEQVLISLDGADLFRVLLVHHPLRSTAKYKRLTDAPELCAILKEHGVDLVLHGHDHIHSTMWFDGPMGRPIPAIGVPSASSIAHGSRPAAAYNLFSIARHDNAWRCDMRVRGFGDGEMISELNETRLIG